MSWNKLLRSKLFLFFLIIILAVFGYFFVKELRLQYEIEKEISSLEDQITALENKNQDLLALMEYFNSDTFREKEIRSKLNLKKPGEHVVILSPVGTSSKEEAVKQEGEKASLTNLRQWWDYFFATR